MKQLIAGAVLILVSAVHVTFAQTNDDCGCKGLLAGGVFNKYQSERSESTKRDMLQLLTNSTFEEFRRASSFKGAGDYFGAYGKFGFDANWDRSKFENRQRELKEEYRLKEEIDNREKIWKEYASDVIVNGFNECRRTCNRRGLKVYSSVNDEKNITLTLEFHPYEGQNTRPFVLSSSTVAGATVITDSPPTGKLVSIDKALNVGRNSFHLNRVGTEAVQIVVKGSGIEDAEEYIPAFRKHLPIRPLRFRVVLKEVVWEQFILTHPRYGRGAELKLIVDGSSTTNRETSPTLPMRPILGRGSRLEQTHFTATTEYQAIITMLAEDTHLAISAETRAGGLQTNFVGTTPVYSVSLEELKTLLGKDSVLSKTADFSARGDHGHVRGKVTFEISLVPQETHTR